MATLSGIEPDLLQSVEEALDDRGELRSEELRLGWGLDDRQVERIFHELTRRADVQRGRGLGRHRIFLLFRGRSCASS